MQQRFLLQILLLAQHVSDITMPIIRSSRVLYSGFCLWYFVLWFFQVAGLVWSWGLCVRFAGCYSILQTKYHRQQPLYNTLELLMMGIVVPETCWASNKICNKNLFCIYLAFYFHILTTMHGQNHIKFVRLYLCRRKIHLPLLRRAGLRRRSAAARLLRLWFRIPPGAYMFVCCVCCVLSSFQRRPTDCGASLCVI